MISGNFCGLFYQIVELNEKKVEQTVGDISRFKITFVESVLCWVIDGFLECFASISSGSWLKAVKLPVVRNRNVSVDGLKHILLSRRSDLFPASRGLSSPARRACRSLLWQTALAPSVQTELQFCCVSPVSLSLVLVRLSLYHSPSEPGRLHQSPDSAMPERRHEKMITGVAAVLD